MNDKIVTKPGPKAIKSLETRKTDDHYLVSTTQGRCVQCSKNTKNKCYKCDKRIHQHCYTIYHNISNV